MRSVVFAYHDVGYVCLQELLRTGDEIAAVFTHTDDPAETVWFRSVRQLAGDHGVPVYTPDSVNTTEWIARVAAWQPDFIFSFYYRKILSKEILALARRGALNLHGSLLPKYRGRCPVNWVLIHGERETGVTLHYMEERPDRGDIVAQRAVPITDEDTALTVFGKLTDAAAGLMRDIYPQLRAGTAPRIPQNHAAATYFGGRRPDDGQIDWTQPARTVFNLVRAVTHPYPGAFTFCAGRKLYVWAATLAEPGTQRKDPAGTVLATTPYLEVETANGPIRLTRVQAESEAEMAGPEWAARHAISKGARLT